MCVMIVCLCVRLFVCYNAALVNMINILKITYKTCRPVSMMLNVLEWQEGRTYLIGLRI